MNPMPFTPPSATVNATCRFLTLSFVDLVKLGIAMRAVVLVGHQPVLRLLVGVGQPLRCHIGRERRQRRRGEQRGQQNGRGWCSCQAHRFLPYVYPYPSSRLPVAGASSRGISQSEGTRREMEAGQYSLTGEP